MAKIFVEAYGCSASFADSEMISGMIQSGGHVLVGSSSESDLNIMVTCSVKDATANRMIHRMKELGSRPLVVAGCLPKAESYTVRRFAKNASMMGPNSIGMTLQVVNSTLRGSKQVVLKDTDISKVDLPKVRLNPTVGIVEIASGCMSECTFCQTKLAKGGLLSYRPGDIAKQVKKEVDDGCKEIWLTSTDNGCYGLDIGTDLPELLDTVSEVPRDFMVRVGMMNPMYMPRIRTRLLESLRGDKAFKFLHVPVQSGSDSVLQEMKRGHTADTFRRMVREAREKLGRVTISTDVIVGFPSETKRDFEMTMELLKETRPDIVNVSRYSARPGTEAACREQVEAAEIKCRSKTVSELVTKMSAEINREWIGWQGDVLFDEQTADGIRGRNFAYKPIYVDDKVDIGQTRIVRIVGSTTNALRGTVVA